MKSLSRVRLFATPWTVAYQAPLSMGFSRQEWILENMGCHFLLQGIFPTQGSNLGFPALKANALTSDLVFARASLLAQSVTESPCNAEGLGWEDPLEEGMATHSSILAWRIPWTEEPDGLQSMESQRVGHDWVTKHTQILTVVR